MNRIDIEELKDRVRRWENRASTDLTLRWDSLNEKAEEMAWAQGLDYYEGPVPGKDIISDLDSFPLPPGWHIEQGSEARYEGTWEGTIAVVYHYIYDEEDEYVGRITEVYPVEYPRGNCDVYVKWERLSDLGG